MHHPIGRHSTDPIAVWRSIAPLGKLVAQGLLGHGEVRSSLAAAPAPGADPSGWRARRERRLNAAIAGWTRERALATGTLILRETVHHRVPVWLLDPEDPAEELNRRIAACLAFQALAPDDLGGRLFLHSGRDRRVCMASLGDNQTLAFPDRDAVAEVAVAPTAPST